MTIRDYFFSKPEIFVAIKKRNFVASNVSTFSNSFHKYDECYVRRIIVSR